MSILENDIILRIRIIYFIIEEKYLVRNTETHIFEHTDNSIVDAERKLLYSYMGRNLESYIFQYVSKKQNITLDQAKNITYIYDSITADINNIYFINNSVPLGA